MIAMPVPTTKVLNLATISLLVAFFVFGLFLRFYRITSLGIDGSDNFFYWQVSYEWMNGYWDLTEHYRPFIYWLYSSIMKLTGPNDWVIKLSTAVFDSLTGLLLVFSGAKFRKSWRLGLAAASTYLLLSFPLQLNRSELVHSVSCFFLTSSVFFFLSWTINKRNGLILLCGIFLSCAWSVHPDLAVLGFATTIAVFFKHTVSNETTSVKFWNEFIKSFSFFLFGYWMIFILFSFKFGPYELFINLLGNQGSQSKTATPFLERWFIITYGYIRSNIGPLLLISYVMTLFIFLRKWRTSINSQSIYLFSLPLTYLFFCSLLFSKHHIPRLFIPLIPTLLLFVYFQMYDWKRHVLLPIILVSLVFAANLKANLDIVHAPSSIYPEIANELSTYIPGNEKILITPLSIMHYHNPLSKMVYLQGRGVYLISAEEEAFEEVIDKKKISYVWISDVLFDEKLFTEYLKPSTERRLWSLYKIKPSEYQVELEKQLIRQKMNHLNFKLIHKSKLGEIYARR